MTRSRHTDPGAGTGSPHPPPEHRGHGPSRHGRRWRAPLRRDADGRVVAGVCSGLSRTTGINPTLLRIGFALLSLGSGTGVLLYAIGWLLLPLDGEDGTVFARALTDRRGLRLVAAGIPVLVLVQVLASALHAGRVAAWAWPVFLAVGAGVLVHRNASDEERSWIGTEVVPLFHAGTDRSARKVLALRVAGGVVLAGAGVAVLAHGHPDGAVLQTVAGTVLVAAAVVVVFGPWWLSLARDLVAERQARALAEERARMAAHVHDSVLQTLALIQRSADDPRHVVRLARAQERELRAWLFEDRAPGTLPGAATTLADGVNLLQQSVEADHRIAVQAVVVGECPLSDGVRALLEAAREATVNAATWSGASEVSLYAEVEGGLVTVFVRDRGRGFDPGAVPDGRQGIAHSIVERVRRAGGNATVRSAPGEGTEVELSVPRPGPARHPEPGAPRGTAPRGPGR